MPFEANAQLPPLEQTPQRRFALRNRTAPLTGEELTHRGSAAKTMSGDMARTILLGRDLTASLAKTPSIRPRRHGREQRSRPFSLSNRGTVGCMMSRHQMQERKEVTQRYLDMDKP